MTYRVKLRRCLAEIVYVEVEAKDQDDIPDKLDEMDMDELEWQTQETDAAEIDDVQEI
jgi:hypothetical protein